jgi:hypothetical protein
MPKVTCPLFSVGATGSIAKLLTYRNSPRGYICRKWSQPTGLPSAEQEEVREFTGERMSHWPLISTEDQASWLMLALEKNVEPINAYLIENWRRKRSGLGTTDVWPAVEGPLFPGMIVTAGGEAPIPDCTGKYAYVGEYNGYHYYKREAFDDFFICISGDISTWFIALILGNPDWENCWWNEEGPIGEYQEYLSYTGIPIVALDV